MAPTDAGIAARLRAILSSDEFQPRASERLLLWFEDLVRSLLRWLDALSPARRVNISIVCVVVLVAVAVQVFRSYRDAAAPRRSSLGKGVAADQTVPSPEKLLSRARSLADEGLLRDAARALQEAMLLQTSRDLSLPWRSSLSDWEWIELLHPSESIVDFTRATQRLAFGPRPSRAEFDACAHRVHSLIQGRDVASSGKT